MINVYLTKHFLPWCSCAGESSLLLAVLRERPAHLLGRLVFELGIHPHKLELLMGDFPHLHIIEALVKCCCPQLPSAAMVTTSKGRHDS